MDEQLDPSTFGKLPSNKLPIDGGRRVYVSANLEQLRLYWSESGDFTTAYTVHDGSAIDSESFRFHEQWVAALAKPDSRKKRLHNLPRFLLARLNSLTTAGPSGAKEKNSPPPNAKLLLLLIPRKHREGLLGDLEEEYWTILLPEYGPRTAMFYYWWHAILACVICATKAVVSVSKILQRN